jgi:predicted CopG family antitoxin
MDTEVETSGTTTILVSKDVREKLKDHGKKGETYNDIIAKLIEIAEQEEFYNRQRRILEKGEFVPLDKV